MSYNFISHIRQTITTLHNLGTDENDTNKWIDMTHFSEISKKWFGA